MANQNSAKGNPASKRMSNPNLKARRARSYANGKQNAARRNAEQKNRAEANIQKHTQGILTPWEAAKAARASRREKNRTDN